MEIASLPLSRISVQNGSDFQRWTSPAIEKASQRSVSQPGPSICVNLKIRELTTPQSELSMKRKDRIVGIDGTAQGRMNSTASALIHQRSRAKKPDSISARNILMLTTISRKSAVLTTEVPKTGSFISLV